jgi:acyl-homoserine lactone acylase PvdQ
MRQRRSFTTRLISLIAVLLVGAIVTVWLLLRGSLPQLTGAVAAPQLHAPATIERDALGTATIRAGSGSDAAWALGFVHAQERYFEMDLMRRAAAGELSELVGSAALPMDKQRRPFRMRSRAAQALAAAAPAETSAMAAYVAGVNAGLNALGSRPWEYWLLRVAPKPWTAEDSVLVIDAMFFDLHDTTNARELGFAKIRGALPESVYKFISASGGPWDAPLLGPAMDYPALPPATDIDLSKLDPKLLHVPADNTEKPVPGSNSFAVNGALTSTQSALVANDMHLNLRVPNIWFRARLMYPNVRRAGESVDLIGVTLPGVPTLVAGSNRHVAWAFTNSYGDWMDWVRVNLDADDKTKYRNKSGMQPLQISRETIKVHGGADETIEVRDTEWGPIIAEDADGTPLALAWTALLPGALNLDLARLDLAETVDEAIDTANSAGIAPQNFVVGDRSGNIGWTIAGKIPRREGGYDPLLPSDWSQAWHWLEWLAHAEGISASAKPARATLVDGERAHAGLREHRFQKSRRWRLRPWRAHAADPRRPQGQGSLFARRCAHDPTRRSCPVPAQLARVADQDAGRGRRRGGAGRPEKIRGRLGRSCQSGIGRLSPGTHVPDRSHRHDPRRLRRRGAREVRGLQDAAPGPGRGARRCRAAAAPRAPATAGLRELGRPAAEMRRAHGEETRRHAGRNSRAHLGESNTAKISIR